MLFQMHTRRVLKRTKIIIKLREYFNLTKNSTQKSQESSVRQNLSGMAGYESDKSSSLKSILTWPQYYAYNEAAIKPIYDTTSKPLGTESKCYDFNKSLNDKISMFFGSIVTLEVDAIVNAANKRLRGGGGVDGAIHRAAGAELLSECQSLGGCSTGSAVITKGYQLKAKHVIHTVGPTNGCEDMLRSCYQSSLDLALKHSIRTIAFPCIATGVYNYPNLAAAIVALRTTREFLELHEKNFDRIVFCLFMPEDKDAYISRIPQFFPLS